MQSFKIAAAYIRVSTDDQAEFSPAAQLRELRDYAASHQMLLDEQYIYTDEGISGRRAEKRPAFLQMIADAKRPDHPFDVILVHKFDRFARSREDSVVYKSMLKRAGVDVISIKEPIAEGNYSGVMEAIYESFAEAYSINLSQEVKKGMTEKALRGEPQTAPPFGYRMENKQFYPDEKEAPYVVELFRRFASGDAYCSLAKWMNTCGMPTHRGSKFENRTVEYILRNPVYIGKLRWNPKRRSRRDYADPDVIITRGSHQPLIDQELWDAVQLRVAELKARWRYHARPTYDRKHWLSGIVRCASCGTTLVVQNRSYFKCNNYVRGSCTTAQHTPVSLLESAFISRLENDLVDNSSVSFRIRRIRLKQNHAPDSLKSSLAAVEKKKKRLTDAYLNGVLELEEYQKLKTSLDAERQAILDEISAAEENGETSDPISILRASIAQTLKVLKSETATIEEKYISASSLIESAIYDKATQTLALTYRISS